MGRSLVATISHQALKHNLNRIRALAPGKKIMAMVKANGYGHGLESVALALEEADAFGVACLEEALKLRACGVTKDIVLMEGFFSSDEIDDILNFDLTVVLHAPHQIEFLKNKNTSKKIKVWIKFNLGMNRLGFPLAQADRIYHEVFENKAIEVIGFMGHFAQADDKRDEITLKQYQHFMETIDHLPGQRSMANSAAILGWQMSHGDWIRPGLALYGASPFPNSCGIDFGLKPAMEFSSTLIAIQSIVPNDTVGYGATWTCPKKGNIGIIAVGYGDGYPWHAKNLTPVFLGGKRLSLVGRVSMDMVAVNLQDCPEAKVGDRVILWGESLPVEEVARHAGTIPYELFCRLTERVKIHHVSGE